MMVPGTGDIMKDIKSEQDSKKWDRENVSMLKYSRRIFLFSHRELNTPVDPSKTRRKSIYSFFLRHQDAVDDHMTSPSVHKKVMQPTETVFSVKSGESPTSPPTKSKRATSFIKKKPRLERGLSDQSVLRLKSNVHLGELF